MAERSVEEMVRENEQRIEPEMAGGRSCLIYFIQCGEAGPIKIGFCAVSRLQERLTDLQTASPDELRVRGAMLGGPLGEATLHRRFAEAHIRGEWFEPTDELTAFVDALEALE